MSFPRYRIYRSGGIPWLDQFPEHWEIVRLGILFKEIDERGDNELPLLSVSIHDGISDKELDEDELDRMVTRSDDRSKYKRVEPGDLVYNMMRAWQGAFGAAKVRGMVSPAYVVARPKSPVCTEFIEYLLRTPQAIEELRRHSHGVTDFRLRLYWDEFKSIQVALPPENEQVAILEFIGRAVSSIDSLVTEQQRLMDLLTEEVSSLVLSSVESRATRQLRLGNAAVLVSRPVVQSEGELYTPIGLFNRGRGLFRKESRQMDAMGDSDFFWIEEGDLILRESLTYRHSLMQNRAS